MSTRRAPDDETLGRVVRAIYLTAPSFFGRIGAGFLALGGRISSFRFYERALSPEEIRNIALGHIQKEKR